MKRKVNRKSVKKNAPMSNDNFRGIDLFEDYENIPPRINAIIERYQDLYGEDLGGMDYKDTARMLEEFEQQGYTFGYGLDNEPYGLRPIGVKLNELKGFEEFGDDEYGGGGKTKKDKDAKYWLDVIYNDEVYGLIDNFLDVYEKSYAGYLIDGDLSTDTNDIKDYAENVKKSFIQLMKVDGDLRKLNDKLYGILDSLNGYVGESQKSEENRIKRTIPKLEDVYIQILDKLQFAEDSIYYSTKGKIFNEEFEDVEEFKEYVSEIIEVVKIKIHYINNYQEIMGMARNGMEVEKKYGIVKDLRTLNAIAKKYDLSFDNRFKYYTGDAYKDNKGENLPSYFQLGERVFILKYFDGSFNPFLYELNPKSMVYRKDNDEPAFRNYPNPQWDKDKYYTKFSEGGGVESKYSIEQDKNGDWKVVNNEKGMYVDRIFNSQSEAENFIRSRNVQRNLVGFESYFAKGGETPMARNGMEVDDLKGGLKNYYVQVENSRGGVSKLIVTDSYEEAEKFYYRAVEDMDYDEINYAEFVAEFNNGEKEIIDFEYADAEYKTWNEAPYGDDDDEYKPWPEAPYGDDDDEDKFGGGGETPMARNGMKVKNWSASDVSNAKYLGILEFEDTQGELHNFEVMETEDRLVFGGMTNSGFIESGYIEKDGRSTNETLENLVADLDVYYTEGVEYTSEIVVNQRMANGGTFGGGGGVGKLTEKDFIESKQFVKGNTLIKLKKLSNPNYYRAEYIDRIDNKKIASYGSQYVDDVIHNINTSGVGGKFGDGGSIAEGNYHMILSQAKEVQHHVSELQDILKKEDSIEAWVVAKMQDVSSTLSDVTHYLDGKSEMPMAKRGMKVANDELPTYDIHLDYVNKSDNDFYYDSMEEIGEFVNSVATEKEIDRYEEMGYDFDHIFGMEMSTKNEGVIFIPRNEKFRNKIVEFIKGKYGNKIRVTLKETTDINLNAKAKRGMKVDKIEYPSISLKEKDLNDDQTEIYAYIETRQELQSQYDTIRKNLMTKIARGEFDETKAPKLFMYLVENGLKLYSKNFGEISLSKQEKEEIANNMVVEFMSEAELGNYENETFLPKKYLAENGMVVMTYDVYDENGNCVGYGMMGQDVVDYANLLWYYDMMDEDGEEIDDFDVAKDYLEQDGFNIESHNPEKSSSATKKRKIIRKMKK